jgi:hypothetical protein
MQNCSAGCIAVGDSHDLKHGVSGTDNDDNPIGPVYPWRLARLIAKPVLPWVFHPR